MSTDILIVGAGPSGLVLATELARRAINFRIIETKPAPSPTSRSFTLHARTMEMFHDIGLSQTFLREGLKNHGFLFNFKGQQARPHLDFDGLDTAFPFILMLSQDRIERILLDNLRTQYSVHVDWNTTLVDLSFDESEATYSAIIQLPDGTQQHVYPKWIVGCDGVHSKTRVAAGLSLQGEMYQQTIIQLMDAHVDGFQGDDDRVHYYMSKNKFLFLARLPDDMHRILVSYKGDVGEMDVEEARQVFQDVVDCFLEGVTLNSPTWVSKWRVWKKLADAYTKRNVVLVGDAVHTHSPSGGQGMNCGMQDAYNLGWKLALVVQGKAGSSLIQSYENERKRIGAQVIAGSDAVHNIILAHGKGLKDRLELTKKEGWHDEAVQRISGLSYHYRDAMPLRSDLEATSDIISAGDRAADIELEDGVRLHDVIRGVGFTLLLSCGNNKNTAEMLDMMHVTREGLGKAVKVVIVGQCEDLTDAAVDEFIVDKWGKFEERYGTNNSGHAILVRPDGYIAIHLTVGEQKTMHDTIRRILR